MRLSRTMPSSITRPPTPRQEEAFSGGEVQADMLEAFGQGHDADHKTGGKHIQRHEALGVEEGVVGVDVQLLHADKQAEGDDAGQHRRNYPAGDDRAYAAPVHGVHGHTNGSKADDRADYGVSGGNRPAFG